MSSEPRPSVTPEAAPRWTTPVIGVATIFTVLSASCCVLPIALAIVGVGGSWIALLGPFVAYRSIILTIVAVVLLSVWFIVLQQQRVETRQPRRRVFGFLCFATIAFVVALTAPQWEKQASRNLWNYWLQTR